VNQHYFSVNEESFAHIDQKDFFIVLFFESFY